MSLQIWLPLNGNLNNYGLDSFDITNNTGATINTSGKLGSCYSFDATNDWIQGTFDKTKYSGKPMSLACWFKCDKTDAGGAIIDLAADLCLGYSYTTDGIRFSGWRCWSNNGTRTGSNSLISTYFNADVWHHAAVTFVGGIEKIYVDGALVQTFDHTNLYTNNWVPLLPNSSYNKFSVGKSAGDANWIGGLINDVRVYDHELSAKEVKEISKCLVLHYKLDDLIKSNLITNYDTSFNSIANGTTTLFTNQMNNGTQEIVASAGGVNKCLHLVSNGGNNRMYKTISCYSGKSYTVSCDYYSAYAISAPFRGELNGGDYSWYGSNSGSYSTPYQWQRVSFTFANLTSNATLYYFMHCAQGTDCYIKNIKVEEGTTATPWVPAGQEERLVVYDSSGLGYNGTLMEGRTINITSDTPRYSYSATFPRFGDGGQCLDMTHTTLLPAITSGTVVWWVKYTSTQNLLLTGNNDIYYYLAASQNNAYYNRNITVSKWYVDGLLVSSAPKPVTGVWHMYAVTGVDFTGWNTFRINRYDGSNAWSLNGSLSDFRIYNTTLSDADILELYQTSASIDKNGNYYTRELIE